MAGCFYTPDQIDAMPMQDAAALLALWREQPPTHELLAAVHGLAITPASQAEDPSNIAALIARAPNGLVKNGSF